MDQLAEDLTTKIVLLNEKRVQDLSYQLADYTKCFRQYFTNCAKIMTQIDVIFPDEPSTTEFKSLVSDDEKSLI